jgi:hypothetical protein
MRNEQEIRDRLNELKKKESDFSENNPLYTDIRKTLRAQMKGLLYALGEEQGFRIMGD